MLLASNYPPTHTSIDQSWHNDTTSSKFFHPIFSNYLPTSTLTLTEHLIQHKWLKGHRIPHPPRCYWLNWLYSNIALPKGFGYGNNNNNNSNFRHSTSPLVQNNSLVYHFWVLDNVVSRKSWVLQRMQQSIRHECVKLFDKNIFSWQDGFLIINLPCLFHTQ